jgi:predicted dehydrogenase
MTALKIGIGVVGCGMISGNYLETFSHFDVIDVVACADLDRERARSLASQYHIPNVSSVEEILANPDIKIIVNLTPPQAHAEIGIAAIRAGKSIYNEKPQAVRREEAQEMLAMANARGLLVGNAPDTFLGVPLQTCRSILDAGQIGQPIAAAACKMAYGPASWHPEPAFYYQRGGGPMFDMGPYFLTALVTLLGPVRRVTGVTKTLAHELLVTSQPNYGARIEVCVPTHVMGMIDFASGVVGTITTSYDIMGTHLPALEIYGTEGTLSIADPSFFDGPVRLHNVKTQEWSTITLEPRSYVDGRGLGVVDMAYALHLGYPHRANGDLAYHMLDIMHAFHEADLDGRHIELTSTCVRPEPFTLSQSAYNEVVGPVEKRGELSEGDREK